MCNEGFFFPAQYRIDNLETSCWILKLAIHRKPNQSVFVPLLAAIHCSQIGVLAKPLTLSRRLFGSDCKLLMYDFDFGLRIILLIHEYVFNKKKIIRIDLMCHISTCLLASVFSRGPSFAFVCIVLTLWWNKLINRHIIRPTSRCYA